MPERSIARFGWARGYYPTTALAMGVQDCLVGGKNLWNRGSGLLESAKGFGGAVANSGGVKNLLIVSDTYGGLTGGGSITQAFAEGVYWFAGHGTAYVGGVSKGSVAGNSVMIWTGSAALQAGLLPPSDVNIALSGGTNGRMKGLASIGCTSIRTLTGGESNVSAPSNEVNSNKNPIRIVSVVGVDPAADMIGIYGSKAGFGEIGPLFHLYDIPVGLAAGHIIQIPGDSRPGWADGQLGDIAPVEFNIPPPCEFVFALNAVIVAAGCYGGAGLSPSWPGNPEGYPYRFVMFIPSGGKVTAVIGSGVEGAVLVATGSSLNLVTAGQTDIPFVGPLNIRPIWPTTGVNSSNQICTVGADIFAWVGTRGPVRDTWASEGDPGDQATAFAAPVMKFFADNGYQADNVVVVYDPASDSVFYVKDTIGIGYCRYLQQWHEPFDFPVPITTGITDIKNGRALFSDAGGNLYQLETGSGVPWSLITQFQGGQFVSFPRTIIGAAAMTKGANDITMELFTDLDLTTPNAQAGTMACTDGHSFFYHLNVQKVRSFAVGLRGATPQTELYGAELLTDDHPVRKPFV